MTANSRQEELLSNLLVLRDQALATKLDDGLTRPLYEYDSSMPVIRDGVVTPSPCPLPRGFAGTLGLAYEWSSEHQQAFQEVVEPLLDKDRWDTLVSEFGTMWANATQTRGEMAALWLEPLAPGIASDLHELGKTKQFRSLRQYEPAWNLTIEVNLDTGEIVTPEFGTVDYESRPIQLGDERLPEDTKPLRSSYRAMRIAERGMTEWFSKRYNYPDYPQPQSCLVCEELYWPQTLDTLSFTYNGNFEFCPSCVRMKTRDVWNLGSIKPKSLKGLLVEIVQMFYEKTNVVPAQGTKQQPIAGLSVEQQRELLPLVMLLPTGDTVKKHFGSWKEYLSQAGLIQAQRSKRGQSGYTSTARCGHKTFSLGERAVCDYLTEHGIEHEKEPVYPQHDELNPNGNLRADWVVGDCWVELAGRMTKDDYAATMAQKKQLAQLNGIRLLVLLPSELTNLDPIRNRYWT